MKPELSVQSLRYTQSTSNCPTERQFSNGSTPTKNKSQTNYRETCFCAFRRRGVSNSRKFFDRAGDYCCEKKRHGYSHVVLATSVQVTLQFVFHPGIFLSAYPGCCSTRSPRERVDCLALRISMMFPARSPREPRRAVSSVKAKYTKPR